MWFRMQKIVVQDTTTSINGVTEFEDVLATKDTTVVTSIPAEPGDFLRVRLLRFSMEYMQSDEAKTENKYHAEAEASEQISIELQGPDPYDADRESISTYHTRSRSGIYVNGEFVGAAHSRNRRYIDGVSPRERNNIHGECIIITSNPPTARTPPFNFTLTLSIHAQEPKEPRGHRNRPYIVDDRPRIINHAAGRALRTRLTTTRNGTNADVNASRLKYAIK